MTPRTETKNAIVPFPRASTLLGSWGVGREQSSDGGANVVEAPAASAQQWKPDDKDKRASHQHKVWVESNVCVV